MRRRSSRASEPDEPTILSIPNLPEFTTKSIFPVFRARPGVGYEASTDLRKKQKGVAEMIPM